MTGRRLALLVVAAAFAAAEVIAQDGPSSLPPRYGTKDQIVEHLGLGDFIPMGSFPYAVLYSFGSNIGLYSDGDDGLFLASGHLPAGSLLTYVELDFCDVSPTKDVQLLVRDCNYLGLDCHDLSILDSNAASQGCSLLSEDVTSLGFRMDPFHRQIFVIAETESGTSDTRLLGVYLGYKLQISPAPPTATFTDVPPSHPYFRAIEALAASGITGGCGAGNFCPNQNITRGEMAAFLARALGLHFPN